MSKEESAMLASVAWQIGAPLRATGRRAGQAGNAFLPAKVRATETIVHTMPAATRILIVVGTSTKNAGMPDAEINALAADPTTAAPWLRFRQAKAIATMRMTAKI